MKLFLSAFSLVLFAAIAGLASDKSQLSEINVTPDFKRIIVQFTGKAPTYKHTLAVNPSRLVLDFDDASIQSPKIHGLSPDCGVAVRYAKTIKGARIMVDFGSSTIPEYKIKVMDNFVLVFLGDRPIQRVKKQMPAQPAASAGALPVKRLHISSNPKLKPDSTTRGTLLLESAKTAGDQVQILVSQKTNPDVIYKVNLTIDFEKLGFNAASITQLDAKEAKLASDGKNPIVALVSSRGPR